MTNIIIFLALVLHLCAGEGLDDIVNSEGLFGGFSVLSENGVFAALNNPDIVSKAYSNFVSQNGKEEDPSKLSTFQANLKSIAAHNLAAKENDGWEMGVNKFTDLTEDEVLAKYTGFNSSSGFGIQASRGSPKKPPFTSSWNSPPASVDWRSYKMVSPVKDQKNCGSCVYFSATGCHESAHALWHNEEILDLSEQMILECTLGKGNGGCQGGGFTPTFDFLQKTGQVTEAQYPYTATSSDNGWDDNKCRQFSSTYKITGWWQVPARDEEALKRYVAFYGPASVAIHVNNAVAGYKRGIFDAKCDGGRNHAVVVVGYGSEGGKDFWIVKNSWSTGYGENGYIRMKRGNGNICDIAGDAVVINA